MKAKNTTIYRQKISWTCLQGLTRRQNTWCYIVLLISLHTDNLGCNFNWELVEILKLAVLKSARRFGCQLKVLVVTMNYLDTWSWTEGETAFFCINLSNQNESVSFPPDCIKLPSDRTLEANISYCHFPLFEMFFSWIISSFLSLRKAVKTWISQ